MTFNVLSLHGVSYSDETDFILIKGNDGELAILKNHIPIVLHIEEGFLELRLKKNKQYVYLKQALIEFKNNQLEVLSFEAQIGKSQEEARSLISKVIKEREDIAKKDNIDYFKLEKDLFEQIKKVGARSINER
jgi:F-type H+-transporting ATPase subunit epsilon